MKKIYYYLLAICLIISMSISHAQNCGAYFTHSANGNVVNFYDTSWTAMGNISSYLWTFGDGSTSTQASPIHTYTSGTYVACLAINTTLGCRSTYCDTIVVSNGGGGSSCIVNYSYTVQSNTASFISTTTGGTAPYSYLWNFGVPMGASTQANPTYTFGSSGTYIVTLTVTDANGSNCSYTDSVVVGGIIQPCTGSYSYFADTTNTVTFTNTTTPSTGLSYLWDFGDNNTSTQKDPVHTYANPGAYYVTMTATSNSPGGGTCTYADTVLVNMCNAYFTTTITSGGTVSFANQSLAGRFGTAYSWNFGDGSFSNQHSPTHTYTTSGAYVVTLSLIDSLNNCSSTYTDSLNIQIGTPSSCSASYTVALDSSRPFTVNLYNTSSNFASHHYLWNFGDGTTGSGRTPTHQFLSFGSFLVTLTITDTVLNCTSTYADTVAMDANGNLKTGFSIVVLNPLTVGIDEENPIKNIQVYPNPAANFIRLDLKAVNKAVTIKILDLSGREVINRRNTTSGNIENIDISSLHKGLYFMLIDDGVTQKIEKFIKSE